MFSVVMVTLLCHPFFSFFNKKNNSMLACRIVCCSHQSDCHIWLCILQQSDYHIQVCILQQSDYHIQVCILQQSDCHIRVCILQQSDRYIRTNQRVWVLFSCKWCNGIRGPWQIYSKNTGGPCPNLNVSYLNTTLICWKKAGCKYCLRFLKK